MNACFKSISVHLYLAGIEVPLLAYRDPGAERASSIWAFEGSRIHYGTTSKDICII
jgi:hypothetical protein